MWVALVRVNRTPDTRFDLLLNVDDCDFFHPRMRLPPHQSFLRTVAIATRRSVPSLATIGIRSTAHPATGVRAAARGKGRVQPVGGRWAFVPGSCLGASRRAWGDRVGSRQHRRGARRETKSSRPGPRADQILPVGVRNSDHACDLRLRPSWSPARDGPIAPSRGPARGTCPRTECG